MDLGLDKSKYGIEIHRATYRLAANDWRVGTPCTRSNPLSMILAPAMRERYYSGMARALK